MSKFQEYQSFIQDNNNYSLLPFRFSRLDEDQVFLSNIAGQYLVLNNKNFDLFAKKKLEKNSELYNNLRTNHFLYDDLTEVNKQLLAIKYKTRINNLSDFTKLHMFVISLRCEHSCPYCQVSRQSQDKQKFDMTKDIFLSLHALLQRVLLIHLSRMIMLLHPEQLAFLTH